MGAVERRFATSFREADTDEPGLVLEDDGTIWRVKPDGTRVELTENGGSQPVFSGCRYPILNPGTGGPWTAGNGVDFAGDIATKAVGEPLSFYDTDSYAAEGFDSDGFFNGTSLTIPADGYYRIAADIVADFSGASTSTRAEVIIGSSRDSEWDTADHETLGKVGDGSQASAGHKAVTHWLAQGDTVDLHVLRDGTAAEVTVQGAIEVVFVGTGTDPAL